MAMRRTALRLVFVGALIGGVVYVALAMTATDPALRTVALGQFPRALAADVTTGHVFVASDSAMYTNEVAMLDASSGAVLNAPLVRGAPWALAVDSRHGHAFVANAGAPSVSVIDTRTGALVRTVPLIGAPNAIAVDARTARVFVTGNNQAAFMGILDARTGTALRQYPSHAGPHLLVADETLGRVFVTNDDYTIDTLNGAMGARLRTAGLGGARALSPWTSRGDASSSRQHWRWTFSTP
jgi:YVTN family beta-propeller protein